MTTYEITLMASIITLICLSGALYYIKTDEFDDKIPFDEDIK